MSFSLVIVAITSLMYLSFGVALFFYPGELLKKIGIIFLDPVGIMEVRAFYGGLEIGLGLFILVSYYLFEPRYALLLSIFILFFTLVGRAYGTVVDSAWSNYLIYAVIIEGSLLLLNSYCFYASYNKG